MVKRVLWCKGAFLKRLCISILICSKKGILQEVFKFFIMPCMITYTIRIYIKIWIFICVLIFFKAKSLKFTELHFKYNKNSLKYKIFLEQSNFVFIGS